MISGDLGYVEKDRLQQLRGEIGDVGTMLKAMIKSLERKPLKPGTRPELAEGWDCAKRKRSKESLNPGTLGPFLPTNWEQNQIN